MKKENKESETGEIDRSGQFPWHATTKEECFEELGCNKNLQSTGLSSEEAAQRLEKYGTNEMSTKEKVTIWQRIWHQITNVLVFILVFVAVIAFIQAIRSFLDNDTENTITWILQVVLILFVITINTIIGIIQEGSAEEAANALKAMLSADAVVLRDGQNVRISAATLVPGDIVRLALGDRVPADMRMIEVANLAVLEAALTGESVPIDKTAEGIIENENPNAQPLGDRHNMCFSATLVTSGAGTGVVVNTGDHTEIGTINTLVNKVEKKRSNVLEQIDTVSKVLAFLITIVTLITWCIAFFITEQEVMDALSTALTAAVAMIPEGLEAIVTMTYAWAVSNMAKQNAIVRALPAVETLGSVTVICSDKTGTLTKNEMTLVAFVTSGKRWKFFVDAKERTANNFTSNMTYMATRSDHKKYLKSNEVIKGGPTAVHKTKSGKESRTFPFGVTTGFGKTAHAGMEPEEPVHMVESEAVQKTFAEESSESPDSSYLRKLLCGGILCSKCVLGEEGGRKGEIGNPTELAILRAAYFGNVNVTEVKTSAPVIAEVPFSSEYKFMATVHEPITENDGSDNSNELIVHVKGAPDQLIPLCKYQANDGFFDKNSLEPCNANFWIETIAVLSSHGLRVLALTRGTLPKCSVQSGEQLKAGFVQDREPWLTIVGLCAIMDPPRPECVDAVSVAHRAGVRVAMITGDHKDTALAIGRILGLVDKEHPYALTGPELDAMTEEELNLAVKKYNVFARASPQNKIKIVKALQAGGEICGMTGDGVNDAPALKAADMGVAMGKEGTDVAREACDMILADDNFATIVVAVREGRVVWDNLRKVLMVNTPINNAQGMSVLFGLALGLKKSPLSSIQVLYCNLVCACTLGFVTAVEPAEEGIMDQPPRKLGKRLIGRFLCLRIVLGSAVLITCTVGSVFWYRSLGPSEIKEERSIALNVLSFGACSICASGRFERKSAFHKRSFMGNPLAFYSYLIMAVGQIFITYTPGVNEIIFSQVGLTAWQCGVVVLFMVCTFVIMEIEKSIRSYLHDRKYDTQDREYDIFDSPPEPDKNPLPEEVHRFGLSESTR